MMIIITAAFAAIEFEPALMHDTESVLTVLDEETPDQGETVRVVHRPGTIHERERAIGITDGRGRVRWTPEHAGVARVRVGDHTQPVHIAWQGPPSSVWVLLAVLLATSLGFALSGFRRVRSR